MSLTEKLENHLSVEVIGGPDLFGCSELLAVVRQGRLVLEYVPEIVSASALCVVIPFEDAMKLDSNVAAMVQLMGVDGDGICFASQVHEVDVMKLIREEGYHGRN